MSPFLDLADQKITERVYDALVALCATAPLGVTSPSVAMRANVYWNLTEEALQRLVKNGTVGTRNDRGDDIYWPKEPTS